MRQRAARRCFGLVMALAVSGWTGPGQQAASGQGGGDQATTATEPEIDLGELRIRLLPLTKDELHAEVDAWRALLKSKVELMSELEIQLGSAEGDERAEIVARLGERQTERIALTDRTREVIKSLRDKGGDVEEHEQYVDAVSGFKFELTAVVNWLKSPEGGLRWARNIGLFLATLLAFWVLARILRGLVTRALGRFGKTSDLLCDFLANLTSRATFVVGVVVALSLLEVNIGPLVAAIGAAGLVLGFALQGTLSNFASGIMILLYRPYDVGSVVKVAGVTGKVMSMTMVSTTINTPDNQLIVVPNNSIWGDVITNISGHDTRRVDLVFGIGYDDDIEKAQQLLLEIASSHEKVLEIPEPVVRLHELAESSVNFIVRPWVQTPDYWEVLWDLTREVKKRFDAEGISIPYPQRDVHVHQEGT